MHLPGLLLVLAGQGRNKKPSRHRYYSQADLIWPDGTFNSKVCGNAEARKNGGERKGGQEVKGEKVEGKKDVKKRKGRQ